MVFNSLTDIVKASEERNIPFWEAIREKDCLDKEYSKEESFEKMRLMFRAMEEADFNYDPKLKSGSLLVGGDGERVERYFSLGKTMSGGFIGAVMATAIKMAESNACMKRIVAAPTAGSCGILPAVLINIKKDYNIMEDDIVKALYTAAGVGEIIATRASISGAKGGCQAEIGASSAMAAAAAVFIMKGTNEAIIHSVAIALKGLLGLSCDPVAGLVEVPCIKRNAMGAVNAITSADLALSGVRSVIPPDEVIDAMGQIGDVMPVCIKETSKGGLAVTPTALEITMRLNLESENSL